MFLAEFFLSKERNYTKGYKNRPYQKYKGNYLKIGLKELKIGFWCTCVVKLASPS